MSWFIGIESDSKLHPLKHKNPTASPALISPKPYSPESFTPISSPPQKMQATGSSEWPTFTPSLLNKDYVVPQVGFNELDFEPIETIDIFNGLYTDGISVHTSTQQTTQSTIDVEDKMENVVEDLDIETLVSIALLQSNDDQIVALHFGFPEYIRSRLSIPDDHRFLTLLHNNPNAKLNEIRELMDRFMQPHLVGVFPRHSVEFLAVSSARRSAKELVLKIVDALHEEPLKRNDLCTRIGEDPRRISSILPVLKALGIINPKMKRGQKLIYDKRQTLLLCNANAWCWYLKNLKNMRDKLSERVKILTKIRDKNWSKIDSEDERMLEIPSFQS
ncbi:hypothetical protein PCE1_004116 [Barthelona sp. PCE]